MHPRLKNFMRFFCSKSEKKMAMLLTVLFIVANLHFRPSEFQIQFRKPKKLESSITIKSNFKVHSASWSQGDLLQTITPHLKSSWMVVCFSNIKYIEIVKIWYKQLEALGYTNHFIVAMDTETFDVLSGKLQSSNVSSTKYRVIKSVRPYNATRQSLHNLWAIRLRTIHQLLSLSVNVFTSDSDTIWKKYVDLDTLPKNYNIFHAYDIGYPKNVFRHFGFVVTGGIGGYIYSAETLELVEHFMQSCSDACDDQTVFNEYYMKSGFLFSGTNETTSLEFDVNKVNRSGVSEDGRFKVLILETDICVRANNPTYCWKKSWDNLWLYSPQAEKTGKDKLEMLGKYKECFAEGVFSTEF